MKFRLLVFPGGFDVAIAGTGYEGIAAAQSDNPDLVVLDLMLPDIDGIDVYRQLDLYTSESYDIY
jgi:DNA-binding response OmpR family regulator